MRKVALIGRCDNTRREAPWFDPEWEKWGLAWDMGFLGDRYFEIHHPNTWTSDTLSQVVPYAEWLASYHKDRVEQGDTLVMSAEHFPGVMVYPLEAMRDRPELCIAGTREPYLESSLAYMLALAYFEGVDRLGIYGVDLTSEDEWSYQRPNMSYLVGVCRGRGIPVATPQACALFDLPPEPHAAPDFATSDLPRHLLEYHLGFARACGIEPATLRADLMTSCFANPPRYGEHIEMPRVPLPAEVAA